MLVTLFVKESKIFLVIRYLEHFVYKCSEKFSSSLFFFSLPILGAIKNSTLPQITGEAVANSLETLEKLGVKDDIEEEIQEHNSETAAEIDEEEKKITRRIYRIDLITTYLLFYTALTIQWLTLLGESNGFGDFFYKFFIDSFNFGNYDFTELSTVGRISGCTASLQIILFFVANLIVLGYNRLSKKKRPPRSIRGPVYFGGILKFFNALKPKLRSHHEAVKKVDAQFSQILGIISQLLIIITASIAANSKLSAIDEFTGAEGDIDPALFPPSIMKRQDPGTTIEEQKFSVRHAALFTKTITIIAILAIIMTSFLNITTWMADIWRVNQNELIIYKIFKYITRLMVCYPCCGDKLSGADEKIDEGTHEIEKLALANKAGKKPQNAEKLLNDAQQSALKNPNMKDLIETTVEGPTQDDIKKISGGEEIKNGEESSKGKKNAETAISEEGKPNVKTVAEGSVSGEGGKPNVEK